MCWLLTSKTQPTVPVVQLSFYPRLQPTSHFQTTGLLALNHCFLNDNPIVAGPDSIHNECHLRPVAAVDGKYISLHNWPIFLVEVGGEVEIE
jgi:hypothetical protein